MKEPYIAAQMSNLFMVKVGGNKGTLSQLNTTSSPLYIALNSFINANDPAIAGKPKAYLNWILLDEQFNYVSSYPQSGAIPVSNFAAGTLGTPGYTGIPITKSGYLYIYVSNETQNWDVFFDNLTVQHRTGPVTEETHYYPFGLTMAGISDKASLKIENKYKFNKGSELQNKEFSDGSGLELYSTFYRSLDPQLGRFWQIDPKPNSDFSLYAAMQDNPISFNDVLGDSIIGKANNAIANRVEKEANNKISVNNKKISKNNAIIASNGAKIVGALNGLNKVSTKEIKKAIKSVSNLGKENQELQNRNSNLQVGIQALNEMRADVNHNFSFGPPASDNGMHHVISTGGKNVTVEGSTDGLFLHESIHVYQSLNSTQGLVFSSDGELYNASHTRSGQINNEVQSYQVQFSLDGSFIPGELARNLSDINAEAVERHY